MEEILSDMLTYWKTKERSDSHYILKIEPFMEYYGKIW